MIEKHPEQNRQATDSRPKRRTFFHWLTYGLGAVATALAGLPLVGYVLATKREQVAWVDLGPIKKFPLDETRIAEFDNPIRTPWDGIVARTNVFVRHERADDRQQDTFMVLAVNCAHLGCPVSWFPESGLFMCPCHGGVYSADGEQASGPPPRGLFHCPWRVRNGRLEAQAPHFPTLHDTEKTPV